MYTRVHTFKFQNKLAKNSIKLSMKQISDPMFGHTGTILGGATGQRAYSRPLAERLCSPQRITRGRAASVYDKLDGYRLYVGEKYHLSHCGSGSTFRQYGRDTAASRGKHCACKCERYQVGPEVGPTSAFCSLVFPQECIGKFASFGPT